jgi:RNA polymerase sigma factor (sigma-70 family)
MNNHLNDHEIIYLIVEGDEDAFTLMVNKYHPLIFALIRKFRLSYMYDDIYQDAVMTLHKSVFAYDPSFNKTFTRFLELNLKRMMMTTIDRLKRQSETLYLYEEPISYRFHAARSETPYHKLYLDHIKDNLTETEYDAFVSRVLKQESITDICERLKLNEKTVYNAIYRARLKIKELFPDGA